MNHNGGCHCGNILVEFETEIAPGEIEIRACQCSFCRKHGTRAAADPDGLLTITVIDPAKLNRYIFGYGTAEFLICRECGVYVSSLTLEEENKRGIVIINTLDNREEFNSEPLGVSYDLENQSERLQRRNEGWTPATLTLP